MKIYEFEESGVVLDASSGVLTKASGEPVELRPQSREVLRVLVTSPNRTVTKQEFSDAVWDGRQVGDDSLVQCIAEIRTALGDDQRSIVQTVPRKGYRFSPPQAPKGHSKISRKTRLALPVVGLVLAVLAVLFWMRGTEEKGLPVVAVLPLDDLSAEPHQGHLNDALSEGIITELARFPQFRVVARNSSFQFRDKPTDVREIGQVLGTDYVLEGSQQFDGMRLRVTAQLVETETGAHVFADKYERDISDLFVVQSEIVRHVASEVGQALLSDMPERSPAKDVDSRLRGLQARNIMTQLTRENWQKAIALEETSIREEPDSAWGYIGKSLMLIPAAVLGWMQPRDEVLADASELAKTALRIDPENYLSHYALARVLSRQGKHAESILHFERAAKLNPSDSIVYIGMSVPLLYSGRTDEALAALHKAQEVDPLHGDWLRWQLGLAYWQNDECEKGLEAMQSMASPPIASNKALAAILVCLDKTQQAIEAMAKFLETRPGYTLEIEAKSIPSDWKPDGMYDLWLTSMKRAGMP
ncbi:winged helix-turn-helix domain-containing tetratricopeptide repeat protein [Tropicimonas marinistellae]|uniref:winged helix-turn-helix domain-containing tetratricopeptide repeat protein n=1 Tax=Tropicimonas marinistellae TaxID=1739787 RepID=UPI000836985B|nr:winged helix-turn-helix domain-containing protein [Tropicimonas marinistellae]